MAQDGFLFRSTPTASKSGLDWRPIAFRARLQCQRPSYAPVDTWQRAIEDGGRFLDAWGTDAATMRWTVGELFDAPRDGRSGGLAGVCRLRERNQRARWAKATARSFSA